MHISIPKNEIKSTSEVKSTETNRQGRKREYVREWQKVESEMNYTENIAKERRLG